MSRRTHVQPPPGGWPWERPGFLFFTPGFPPGYEPRLAREALMTPNEIDAKKPPLREVEKGKY